MCAIGTTATCKPADPPSGAEQIYLQGRLDFSASPDDVEAYVDDNAVYVQFNQKEVNNNTKVITNIDFVEYFITKKSEWVSALIVSVANVNCIPDIVD